MTELKQDSKMAAAGAVFFNSDDQILIVKPTYKDNWEIPGGLCEAHESPTKALKREILEELSIEIDDLNLLVAEWSINPRTQTDIFHFVFDGGKLSSVEISRIKLPAEELETMKFIEAKEAVSFLGDRVGPRVLRAIEARVAQTLVYYEL